MPSVPRIVIADASGEIAQIVRGALALLSRQSVLVEVPTSEDALVEIAHSDVDLVVTAYQVPGERNGVELAHHISHQTLRTPVIVLAQEGDPRPDSALIDDAPFQFFVRPTAEPFLRGMRIALDGGALVTAEHVTLLEDADYGPLPPLDLNAVRALIINLIRDVGAMGIILADRNGRILVDEGATGYIDRETMAAVLGPMFARVADIGPLVGGNAWAMHYYNGERLDVYGLALGVHYLLGLIFEGASRRAMASVMLYGRQTAHQIVTMLGDAAFQVDVSESAVSEDAPHVTTPVDIAEAPAVAQGAEARDNTQVGHLFEPVTDLDIDTLFGQGVDEELADSLFDVNELSDIVASLDADDDAHVGYDEAVDMGILDD